MDIFCRTCMHQFPSNCINNVEAFNIFHVSNLAEKLRICLNQTVAPEDEYPKSLCQKCYEKVCDFYEFQLMCKESLKTYQDILEIESNVEWRNKKLTICNEKLSNDNVDVSIEFNPDDLIVEDDENYVVFETEFDYQIHRQPNETEDSNLKNTDSVLSPAKIEDGTNPKVYEEIVEETITEDEEKFISDFQNNDHYYCNLCPMVFPSEQILKTHLRQHQGLGGYPCTREKCTQSFNRLNDLRKHLRDHADNRLEIYKCDVDNCGKEFITKSAINAHMREQHNFGDVPGSRKYICQVCGAHLANSRCLQDHKFLHINRKHWPFACDVKDCSARFRKINELNEHKNRHDGIKPYECPHCDKRFYTASNLSVHINFHTHEKKWLCHMCTRVFFTASNLKFHLQKEHEVDQENVRFPCRLCDKTLSTQTARKYHEMTHTGDKPHICDVCGRGFIQPSSLKAHKRTHLDVGNRKEFSCSKCEKAFPSITALKKHDLEHEENSNKRELYESEVCYKFIKNNSKIKYGNIFTPVDFQGQREMELD